MAANMLVRAGRRVIRQIWRWPLIELLLIVAGATVVLVAILGPVTIWAAPINGLQGKDRADVINATRQILLAAGGGLALLVGAAFTARTFHLSRRGQLADRYARAIALLASEKITERLGGIYSLEHLLRESPDMHSTIVEVLAAFVRDSAPRTAEGPDGESPHAPDDAMPLRPPRRPATDVQAALTVLGRRAPDRREPNPIDLSSTDLAGADLAGARLAGVNFTDADLTETTLSDADLTGASLVSADLRNAIMVRTRLNGAYLTTADLRQACLANAVLQKASLVGAAIDGAILDGAQLQGALLAPPDVTGLSAHQLAQASVDATTELPVDLRSVPRP